MAENTNTLLTRIQWRNDTSANWEAANPQLMVGEAGYDTTKNMFKIGRVATAADVTASTGKATVEVEGELMHWNNLEYANDIPEIDLSSVTNDVKVYNNTSPDALPNGSAIGDMAIIQTIIYDDATDDSKDKYSRTAYVWNGTAWAAMDGNYNAENIYFDEDLISTYAIGNITLTNGQGTVASTGKNLKEVWSAVFQKPTDPTVDTPTVTLSKSGGGEAEVGKTFSLPSATLTVTDIGSYNYGPADTGVRFPVGGLYIQQEDKTTNNKTNATVFTKGNSITLTANDTKGTTYGDSSVSYKFTATAKYTPDATVIPVNNLGTEKPALRIGYGKTLADDGTLALTVTSTPQTATYTGFRKMFMGTMTSKPETMTSAQIRALSGIKDGTGSNAENGKKAAKGEQSLPIPTGTLRAVVAVPTGRTLSKVLDVNDSNSNITGSFKSTTVNVEGYNGYAATSYNVYYFDYAAPGASKDNTFKVTIA